MGAEDALGDMDFKVAGTRNVITALQLDMKIEGLPSDVLRNALNQAMDARHHILDIMEDTISEPAESLSGNAPRLETIELPKDKIGEVIGPKGKNIRKIEEETGCSVEIDDDLKSKYFNIYSHVKDDLNRKVDENIFDSFVEAFKKQTEKYNQW